MERKEVNRQESASPVYENEVVIVDRAGSSNTNQQTDGDKNKTNTAPKYAAGAAGAAKIGIMNASANEEIDGLYENEEVINAYISNRPHWKS